MKQEVLNEFKRKWFKSIGYSPHNGQEKLHFPQKNARFTVCVCGRRWGKTVSASREAGFYATQPNKRIWCVAPTYSQSEKMFREIYDDLIIHQKLPYQRASYKEQYIKFEWGSTVEGKSADNPPSLVGEGLDLLILDECAKMKKKTWDMYLRPTLSDRKGKAIFITTPEGYNWVHELFLLGKTDEAWLSFNSPSWENQYAYPEGVNDVDLLEARRNLAKEIFDQEYGALFTSFMGRVYPFDMIKDVVKDYKYDPFLPTYCSIDFGYRMPSAIWMQTKRINGKWHVFVFDEIVHEKNIKTDVFAEMIMAKNYNVRSYYGDPAGYNVQSQSGMGDIEIFRRKGINVYSVRDKVSRKLEAGISHVRGFIENAEGERFLHVSEKCEGLISDLSSYAYPEHIPGSPLKPEPVKDGYHDHGCDALRYFFVNRFPIRNNSIGIVSRSKF